MPLFNPSIATPVSVALGGTGAATRAAAQNNLGLYSVNKAAITTRTSTTTYADDNELVLALPVGKFRISGQFIFQCASATPGAKAALAFSGTYTVLGGSWYFMDANPAFYQGRFGSPGSTPNPDSGGSGIFTINRAAVIAQSVYFWHYTLINVTVAGNLTGQWAQVISSVDATNLLIGSNIEAQQLPS